MLIDIGFIAEQNKTIFLSELGKDFARSKDDAAIKDIYTKSLEKKKCFGVYPIPFFKSLIAKVEDSIDKFEFAYFVQYSREESDLDLVANLILFYRKMAEIKKDNLKKYIDKQLGGESPFFRDVSIKMSLIGFCQGLLYDKDRKEEVIVRL